MEYALIAIAGVIATLSIVFAPIAKTVNTFFSGSSSQGEAPSLITLTFSQVTTWIFARSLMNAAILGYYYGIWGTLAYALYYLSFLTGGKIIDKLRFEQGFASVQDFLQARFGRMGVTCYNIVIIIRLVSEVFANLLVIGMLFGMAGSNAYILAIIAFSAVTLLYSMLGGLHASLKTDVLQMSIFVFVLLMLLATVLGSGQFAIADLAFKEFQFDQPGPILMLVALLQIWSYPMHDPVMMDRGFIADRDTTRKSFYHAAWISIICIIAFGVLGVWAGAHAGEGDTMNTVLIRLLGDWPMLLFSTTLVVSAMSTLDSTLSSSAKLIAVDMRLVGTSVKNGRVIMLVFMLLGLLCVFFGNQDLFSAVAVSGTASLFLAPVVFFSIFGKQKNIPSWSYLFAFMIAILGAGLYFLESSGHTQWLGDAHKYTKLLIISLVILVTGCALFFVGQLSYSRNRSLN
ncbi:MAG: sodium:proline symporter [Gammaproteobacteria bacterium]|nr:MAG: sodium:proline symporter [Gammaproteobacteria bacterium]